MTEAANWRDPILREFSPQAAPLTLVQDPNCLLTEEKILQLLQERGYELLVFQDPVEFRFAYESQYRERLFQAKSVSLIVALESSALDPRSLPYDLVKLGRTLSFSLADIFPTLSCAIVSTLDPGTFDRLYYATLAHPSDCLGDNDTKAFILQHVFQTVPALIKTETDLLRMLLKRHYRDQKLPPVLDDYLIQHFRRSNQFQQIPVETILADRQAFFNFLQQQWLHFVQRQLPKARLTSELKGKYGNAPVINIPLEDEDIRVYIDNLFLEGHLRIVAAQDLNLSSSDLQPVPWITTGICVDPEAEAANRLEKLLLLLTESLPAVDANYRDWLSFAPRWAELVVLWWQANTFVHSRLQPAFISLQTQLDTTFLGWIQQSYGGLFNQSPPVMLHHIPRIMARQMESATAQKVALVVLDGMAFDQWLILRGLLQEQEPDLCFQESAVFAWLPTITSVSRQALFAGKSPSHFPSSIHSTHREEALWLQFWVDQGVKRAAITYAKAFGEENSLPALDELLADSRLRVIGLVVNSIDDRMHHVMDGTAGLHLQVAQWGRNGFLHTMIKSLLENKFTVFLTSDHGNIAATGIGSPSERAIADRRGERVRVYNNETLRQQVRQRFPMTLDWTPNGLPKDYLPLFAPGRAAFVSNGDRIVGHGGISVEEVIVPLIQIQGSNV